MITGLPPALPALPLELTVLYNSLLFTVGSSDSAIEGESEGIRQGLLRGKEIVLSTEASQGEESVLCDLEMCGDCPEVGGGGCCEQDSLTLPGRVGGGVACSQR